MSVHPTGIVVYSLLTDKLFRYIGITYLLFPPPRTCIHFRIHSLPLVIENLYRLPQHIVDKGSLSKEILDAMKYRAVSEF
jgi:hypothetical protein